MQRIGQLIFRRGCKAAAAGYARHAESAARVLSDSFDWRLRPRVVRVLARLCKPPLNSILPLLADTARTLRWSWDRTKRLSALERERYTAPIEALGGSRLNVEAHRDE
jgi:hypothetical protein